MLDPAGTGFFYRLAFICRFFKILLDLGAYGFYSICWILIDSAVIDILEKCRTKYNNICIYIYV